MPAAAMLTRQIPSTGEAIPVIGLGTWRAFDVGTDEATRWLRAKGHTIAVPAQKVAYLYFTAESGRKVGFGLGAS